MSRRILVCLCLLVASACMATGSMLQFRGTGTSRCYAIEYETLWEAVVGAVRFSGLVVENANQDAGTVLAQSYRLETRDPEDMALEANQGEAVAVFIEAEGTDVWGVEIVSRRRFALDPSPRDWTNPVFLALEDLLPASASAENDELAACTRARGLEPRIPPSLVR